MQVASTLPASPYPQSSNAKPAAEQTGEDNKPKSLQQDEQLQARELQNLKNRDREVRAHELAHQSVGGRYVTRGARYDYERGPDGRQYAVSGDVAIDTSPTPGDPQATLEKAQIIHRAALAPANPSATDRQVAARASVMIQQARIELSMRTTEEQTSPGSNIDLFA